MSPSSSLSFPYMRTFLFFPKYTISCHCCMAAHRLASELLCLESVAPHNTGPTDLPGFPSSDPHTAWLATPRSLCKAV